MGSYEPYTNDSPITTIGQNEAHWRLYRQGGLNKIRQLQDRAIDLSADGGEFAEAYVDSNGQLNSIDDSNTTSAFVTNKYIPNISNEISSETTTSSGMINTDNSFDKNLSTYSSTDGLGSSNPYIGKTFSSVLYDVIYYNFYTYSPGYSGSIYLQTYDGSSWTTIKSFPNDASKRYESGIEVVNTAIQGVRLLTNLDSDHGNFNIYELSYGNLSDGIIIHNIPSNSVPSSSVNYVDDVEHEVTNGSYQVTTQHSSINNKISYCTFDIKSTSYLYYLLTYNYIDGTSYSKSSSINNSGYITVSINNLYPTKIVDNITLEIKGNNNTYSCYSNNFKDYLVDKIIYCPLSSTISTSFGTALVSDWEDGANIQYKLVNDSEDTGWLNINEVSTFTPFTSEPTKCIAKLIPKASNPTAGYPSIKGISINGWSN